MLHKITERRGMLTKTQISTALTEELEDLRDRLEAELARRELDEREPTPGRQVVDEKPHSTGTLRLEMVKCGKDRCKKCERGEGHGPYWYLYYRRNGKLTSTYLGKMIPVEL
jgi:hypothetical protein